MRNLAKDIVEQGTIYEPPLVSPEGTKFVIYDGNRRVTCLKLVADPRRAPTTELRTYFQSLRSQWKGPFTETIQCQVENDRDRIDSILFRRHTGSQNGVGQSTWDDRMKKTFVERTGKGSGVNVADEVERRLAKANLLPSRRRIPRSTMNRLLSAETFRNRVGISVRNGRFELTHQEDAVLAALSRVADDLASRDIVLADIWDIDGKRSYLDRLEKAGVLPSADHGLAVSEARRSDKVRKAKPTPRARPSSRVTLIPQPEFPLTWPGRLQRHHHIWEELQFRLELSRHPNAISVLFRVLLELAVENYISRCNVPIHAGDSLAQRALKSGQDLYAKGKISKQQLRQIQKFRHFDRLVSADTLNRYVHSASFAPSPEHLMALWDSMAGFIVDCLNA